MAFSRQLRMLLPPGYNRESVERRQDKGKASNVGYNEHVGYRCAMVAHTMSSAATEQSAHPASAHGSMAMVISMVAPLVDGRDAPESGTVRKALVSELRPDLGARVPFGVSIDRAKHKPRSGRNGIHEQHLRLH